MATEGLRLTDTWYLFEMNLTQYYIMLWNNNLLDLLVVDTEKNI